MVTVSILTFHLDSGIIALRPFKSINPLASSPLFDSEDLSQKALNDDLTSASKGCNKK